MKLYEKSYDFDALVVDGANKQAVAEMQRRHNLPLQAADKTGKADFIELMNGELTQGKIKIDPARCCQGKLDTNAKGRAGESLALADEYAGLIWDARSPKREEHPGCANHLADAALYGWRHCYQYLSKAPEKRPEPNSHAWYLAETERMREAEEEELRAQKGEPEGLGDSENWEWWAK